MNGANLSIQFDAYGTTRGVAVNNVYPDYSVLFYCPPPAGSAVIPKDTPIFHYVSIAGSAVCTP
jgi:hypothetical protein